VEEATWEPLEEFKTRFPDFQLEDELFVEEGRDVMAQPVAHQEGAQAQGEAQPLVPQAPKPPIVYRRRIRTRR
jgi:hypothetical protein